MMFLHRGDTALKTTIHSNDFRLTQALERFIKRSINKSLLACIDQVERVSVRLRDINGPKGGDDKECCVEVKLSNAPTVVVSKRNSDAYTGIRKALGRASRATLRRLNKKRGRKLLSKPSMTV